MPGLNLKGFLASGFFLQKGPDTFQLSMGPFNRRPFLGIPSAGSLLFYKPDFWDFMKPSAPSSQEPVYEGAVSATMNREEFIYFLSSEVVEKPQIRWASPEEGAFADQFRWSQSLFRESHLVKTVPIIRQTGSVEFTESSLLWCLRTLISEKMFGWSYGFFQNGSGAVGHSPEVLVSWDKSEEKLRTAALAGTYPKSSTPEKILSDRKIRREHQIVVDDITHELSGFSGQLTVGQTKILSLRHLDHLITEFEARIESHEQAFEVLRRLHPTAAMGLFPRNEKFFGGFSEFDLQKQRSTFAAPFMVSTGSGIFAIAAIRNFFFRPEGVEIFSGCGVTDESDLSSELAELEVKRNSVKKMMGLS